MILRRPRVGASTAAALAALAAASPVRAQQNCEFLPGTGNVRGVTIGESRITYLSTPNLACEGGVRIQADSAVVFESSGYTQLFGSVRFEDPERQLRAREAQYFDRVGRLQAQQDVELVRKTDGSILRGDDLIYLRGTAERPERLTVTGNRASATLRVEPAADTSSGPATVAADSAAGAAAVADTAAAAPDTAALVWPDTVPPAPPRPAAGRARPDTAVTYDVLAEEIVVVGGSGFVAVGRGRPVEIVRDSLRAYGDSVAYDEVPGTLALREDARMEGAGYDLTGDDIDVLLPGQDVREVTARGSATLVGEDVRLVAPRIRMFLTDGLMERLVAMPLPTDRAAAPPAEDTAAAPAQEQPAAPAQDTAAATAAEAPLASALRARATAETFELVADSIEVLAPGEVLERLVAVGDARGESTARDSLNTPETPPVARRDWIEGDTIVAVFSRSAAADTSAYQLERLEARASARSLYRLEPSDSARATGAASLAVHYVTGDEIVIEMEAGEVERMEVVGPARGLHLEPRVAPAAPADTTDTTAAPAAAVDTAATDSARASAGAGRAPQAAFSGPPSAPASPVAGAPAHANPARREERP